MTGQPSAIMAAIIEASPTPWTVEVTFRTKAGEPVFTYYPPCEVTSPDQTVSIEVDLWSACLTGPGFEQ